MSVLSLLSKENPEDLPVPVSTNLVDITTQMAGGHKSLFSHLLHGASDGGSVDIIERIDELLDGATPHRRAVVAPPTSD